MKGFFNIKFSSTSVHTFYKKCIYDVINILLGKNYRGSCPELVFFQKDVQSLSNLLDNDL